MDATVAELLFGVDITAVFNDFKITVTDPPFRVCYRRLFLGTRTTHPFRKIFSIKQQDSIAWWLCKLFLGARTGITHGRFRTIEIMRFPDGFTCGRLGIVCGERRGS